MHIFILLVGSFVASLVSGAAGFGGSLLLLPIATATVGAELAVPILTISQLIGNIARMSTGWKQIDWKSVRLFSLTALPLASLGAFGFSILPKTLVTRWIGVFSIILVILKIRCKKELPIGKNTLRTEGGHSGEISGLCGSGEPKDAAV